MILTKSGKDLIYTLLKAAKTRKKIKAKIASTAKGKAKIASTAKGKAKIASTAKGKAKILGAKKGGKNALHAEIHVDKRGRRVTKYVLNQKPKKKQKGQDKQKTVKASRKASRKASKKSPKVLTKILNAHKKQKRQNHIWRRQNALVLHPSRDSAAHRNAMIPTQGKDSGFYHVGPKGEKTYIHGASAAASAEILRDAKHIIRDLKRGSTFYLGKTQAILDKYKDDPSVKPIIAAAHRMIGKTAKELALETSNPTKQKAYAALAMRHYMQH